MTPRYYVTTWDRELEEYTPQKGVRKGPWSLFGLRKPLRMLREMGHDVSRMSCFDIFIERKPKKKVMARPEEMPLFA